MIASGLALVATFAQATGISQEPGTRTIVMRPASTPWRTRASVALAIRRSTMKSLNRLATMVKRALLGATRLPSTTWGLLAVPSLMELDLTRFFRPHRKQGDSLDDLQAESREIGNFTGVVGEEANLVQFEVGQDLGPEAELAQRRVAGRRALLEHLGVQAQLGAEIAHARQVDADAPPRAL